MEIGRAEIGAVRCRHEGRPPASRIVANARSLDLEDVGAKIREKLAGPGAREDAGQFADAAAFQGTRNAQKAAMPVIARPRTSPWPSRVRAEARTAGKEGGHTWRSGGWPSHAKRK